MLRWKVRPESHFETQRTCDWWNKRWAGTIAGAKTLSAVQVSLDRNSYTAHRLIYGIMGEEIPDEMEIDHRNRNWSDNRWVNLRLATRFQNMRNASKWSCKVLPKGIRLCGKKFQARIMVDRKPINLGLFATLEKAVSAYSVASKNLHGEFGCHG